MAYELGQYNHIKNASSRDDLFMTPLTSGTVARKAASDDVGVIGITSIFEDECIRIDNHFDTTKNYYFHGKIKRVSEEPQTFTIKLINYDSAGTVGDLEQYIKTIVVAGGDVNDWVDVEFIFTPYDNFDTILFQLTRTVNDYRIETRYPKIIYVEISEIRNIIDTQIKSGVELLKIGIQSRPNLLMCINGEEIRTSRTGIYELKNGVIVTSFFSVVKGAVNEEVIENQEIAINNAWNEATTEEQRKAIQSVCLFSSSSTWSRGIDSFTLDYIYKEGGN